MAKVRITSDGVDGTVVTEDGKMIEGIYSAYIYIGANEITSVNLDIKGTPVNIEGVVDEVELICSICLHTTKHKCSETI